MEQRIPRDVGKLPSDELEEATVYRSEYINYECPHCDHIYHLDTADMIHEGNVDGMRTTCLECKRDFLLSESY